MSDIDKFIMFVEQNIKTILLLSGANTEDYDYEATVSFLKHQKNLYDMKYGNEK